MAIRSQATQSKDRASLANVSPTDQPGHGGDLADNHPPTLAAPATILNFDKIKKRLQAAEKANEANSKNTTLCMQNSVQVKGMLIHWKGCSRENLIWAMLLSHPTQIYMISVVIIGHFVKGWQGIMVDQLGQDAKILNKMISMGGKTWGGKSCQEEPMELSFERGKGNQMHQTYMRLQISMHKKREIKKQEEKARKKKK
jgi:hypothetical protein